MDFHSVGAPANYSRRSFLRRLASVAAVGVGTGLLAACAPSAPPAAAPTSQPAPKAAPAATTAPAQPASAPPPAAAPAKPGGTFTHGSPQEPDRLWGPITGLTVSSEAAHLANTTLVKTNEKLEYVPELVTEVPTTQNGGISPDGLVYTFKLRQGVKWSDGKPFTARDVKFTQETIMKEGVDVRGRVGWNQVEKVETPDDNTVVFRFRAIDASFLDRVSQAHILPEHVLGGLDAQAINKHEWFQGPNPGLGPFTFKEWVRGSHLAFTKNPNYFKPGRPAFDRVVFKIVPDANTLLNQIETGEIDSRFRLNNEHVDIVKGFKNAQLVSVPSATPWLLWINQTRPMFADKRVRQALAYGFDKVGITRELLKGYVEPAWGLISPASWAYNPNIVKHAYDPAKAKQLLDAAGWAPGADGIRAKDGTKLSFEIMNIAGEQERVQVLSFIQRQWRDIGVDARIKQMDVGTMWGSGLPKRNYDMAYSYTGRLADPEMASHYLSPDQNPSNNFAGYSNPEVDKLVLEGARTADQARRKEVYGKAQEIVAEDAVYLFIGWLANHTVLNKRLQGYAPAPAYVEFWNADQWSAT